MSRTSRIRRVSIYTGALLLAAVGAAQDFRISDPIPAERTLRRVELPGSQTIVLGTVFLTDRGYEVRLDDSQVARASEVLAAQPASLPGDRGLPVPREDFRGRLEREAIERLDQLFPYGVPAAARKKDKGKGKDIEVSLTLELELAKPPKVGIIVRF
jgi:hypothetical protein